MGLAEKILAKNKKNREALVNKFNGESYLYMGDPTLQWGVGGFVRGKLNLTWGPKGSGKSSLSLKGAASEQQKTKGYVFIFDSEGAYFDPHEQNDNGEYTESAVEMQKRLTLAGFDWEKVIIISSNRVDDLFSFLPEMSAELKKDPNYISAMVVDSWGGIQSEQAIEKIEKGKFADAGKSFGGNTKTIGPVIQYFQDIANNYGVTIFFVQHCIQNMDANSPHKWVLVGGQKLQFLCHSVTFLESAASKDSHLLLGDVQSQSHNDVANSIKVGKKIYFRCDKSRRFPEGRKGEFWMNFMDLSFALPEVSLFNLASNLGLFDQKGAWFYYPKGSPSPLKFQGGLKLAEAMKNDKDFYNEIFNECMEFGKSGKLDGTGKDIKLGADEGVKGGEED